MSNYPSVSGHVNSLEEALQSKLVTGIHATDPNGIVLDLEIRDVVFEDGEIQNVSFSGSTFINCSLAGSKLKNVCLEMCDFQNCNLAGLSILPE